MNHIQLRTILREAINPKFEKAAQEFVKKLQAAKTSHMKKNVPTLPVGEYGIDKGRKYWRVWYGNKNEKTGTWASRSVHCFLDTSTGDVLKAAGWKVPAKGARGNIFSAQGGMEGMGPYGAHYKGPASQYNYTFEAVKSNSIEHEILDIVAQFAEYGEPADVRTISNELGVSPQKVKSVIRSLIKSNKIVDTGNDEYELAEAVLIEAGAVCRCGSGLESWWEDDARGIPLTRVCQKCRKEKLSKYRKSVLADPNYDSDEPIEEAFTPHISSMLSKKLRNELGLSTQTVSESNRTAKSSSKPVKKTKLPPKPVKKTKLPPTTPTVCDFCHAKKSNVYLQTDPLAHELYDDETLYYICDDCAGDQADSI